VIRRQNVTAGAIGELGGADCEATRIGCAPIALQNRPTIRYFPQPTGMSLLPAAGRV
jgi:hypothetical protein